MSRLLNTPRPTPRYVQANDPIVTFIVGAAVVLMTLIGLFAAGALVAFIIHACYNVLAGYFGWPFLPFKIAYCGLILVGFVGSILRGSLFNVQVNNAKKA